MIFILFKLWEYHLKPSFHIKPAELSEKGLLSKGKHVVIRCFTHWFQGLGENRAIQCPRVEYFTPNSNVLLKLIIIDSINDCTGVRGEKNTSNTDNDHNTVCW